MIFTCLPDGTDWRFEGSPPKGEWWPNGRWELTITEDASGLYAITERRNTLSAAGTRGERAQVSVSHDLKSWSQSNNAEHIFALVRPFTEQLSPRRWMSVMPIGTLRERASIGFSSDGRTYTFGHPIANEVINSETVQYSHLLRGDGCIYAVYSVGEPAPADFDPKDIRFARLDIRAREDVLYAMRSDRAAVELNDASKASYFVDDVLVLPPRASGALEARGERCVITLAWRVAADPLSGAPYVIASVGNLLARATLSLVYHGTGPVLCVNGRGVRQLTTWAGALQRSQIVIDFAETFCEVDGIQVDLQDDIRVYVGDAYVQTGDGVTAPAGNIEIDLSQMSLQVMDRHLITRPGVVRQTGPNLCVNPGIIHNDTAAAGQMPDGFYRDTGGATMDFGRVELSRAFANDFLGGHQYALQHRATVLGGSGQSYLWTQWDGVEFMAGKVMTVAYDAWDNSGLSYDLFTDWYQNFGSGGSTAIETPIFHAPITRFPRRFVHHFRVPAISPSAVFGTTPVARLRWRAPTNAQLCDLRLGRIDIYEGAYEREWMAPNPQADAPQRQRIWRTVARAVDTTSYLLPAGRAISSTEARFVINYDEMRRAPTLVPSAGTDFKLVGPDGTFVSTAVALNGVGVCQAVLTVTVAGGLTTNNSYHLVGNSVSAALHLNAR